MKTIAGALTVVSAVVPPGAQPGHDARQPLPPHFHADHIVVEKARHVLTLYSEGKPVRSYIVALGQGGLEPKMRQGDKRTPEGLYRITGHNPASHYHMSLRISYPNAADISAAHARGVKPGGDIMIHGLPNGLGWMGALQRQYDWTAGCIAVTDREMDEIARAVPDGTPIEIRP